MPIMVVPKRALLAASFFYAWQLLLTSAQAADCQSEQYDERVTVAKVFDGDTVQLKDGRHLRFIAINTPERGRDNNPAEPLADAAKHRLESLLATDRLLLLRFDQEKKDRHGRLLAHPYLHDGRNLSQIILQAGLGFHITVPPNLLFLDCYQQAEQAARQRQRGLWQQPYYQPQQASQLPSTATGFRRITGTVSRIGESRTAYWLNLGSNFALRLPKSDLHYFSFAPASLMGKTLTVRGWVYLRRDELRMNLRHPASIETITNLGGTK
jgi:endonuclease YncB( thermonuclease family)